MDINIKTEHGFPIASWCVYSSNVEKLVIPRIGECVCLRGEYYIVQDVIYNVEFSTAPPSSINILVKKKNNEKDETSNQYE